MRTCFGGIDLGGTYIKSGLIDRNGNILAKCKIPTNSSQGVSVIAMNLRKSALNLLETASKKNLKLGSIGVGSPGTIKYPEGLVTDAAPNLKHWTGTKISGLFIWGSRYPSKLITMRTAWAWPKPDSALGKLLHLDFI